MPTVLITGSNGLVGRELIRAFARQANYTVIATSSSPDKVGAAHFHQLDIRDREGIFNLIEDTQPDVVIHSAAISAPDACELDKDLCNTVNIEGTRNVADACRQVDAAMLYLSTDFVFDGQNGPYTETDTPLAISYYGLSKLAGETIVQRTLPLWAIVRTVLVYGDTAGLNRANFVTWVKTSLEKGESIRVVNDQYRTPTYAPNLAEGIVSATSYMLQHKTSQVWHLSGPQPLISVYDMALAIAAFYRLNTSLIQPIASASLNQPAMRPPRTGFSIEKAQNLLNYSAVEFTNGLKLLGI